MRKVAGRLKLELSQYRDLEAFSQFGSDLDADTQRTLARGARLVKTLNQGERQPLAVADQVVHVYAATNGFLDRILVDKVPDFLDGLTQRFHAEGGDLREKIGAGDWSDEIQDRLKKLITEFADDYGYDLDEDGQPLEEGAEGDSERSTARADDEAADDSEGSEEETQEREAQAAPA
jgi:F-type H+-transporting ATPase subunit alpha